MEKIGRNDLCHCGSGKKFKKCCERKMIGKRFLATKIETKQTASSIASFFQNRVTSIKPIQNLENSKPINAEIKKSETSQENILVNTLSNQ